MAVGLKRTGTVGKKFPGSPAYGPWASPSLRLHGTPRGSGPVHCRHQFLRGPRLVGGVPSVRPDDRVRLGPRVAGESEVLHRAHDVVAVVHGEGRDASLPRTRAQSLPPLQLPRPQFRPGPLPAVRQGRRGVGVPGGHSWMSPTRSSAPSWSGCCMGRPATRWWGGSGPCGPSRKPDSGSRTSRTTTSRALPPPDRSPVRGRATNCSRMETGRSHGMAQPTGRTALAPAGGVAEEGIGRESCALAEGGWHVHGNKPSAAQSVTCTWAARLPLTQRGGASRWSLWTTRPRTHSSST